MIILPETDVHGATTLAEKIRLSVREIGIQHASSDVADCITISAGVVTAIPSDQNDPVQILAAADAALYKAKDNGRDRIEIAEVKE